MMREVNHRKEWHALWTQARRVSGHYGPGGHWGTDETEILRRETFEFLRTGLVYHRNALDNYTDDRLHGLLRPPSATIRASTTINTLLDMDDPLFNRISAPEVMVAGPHLASAVVRVSAAVLKVTELHKRENCPETDFQKAEVLHPEGEEFDWSRGRVYAQGLLDKVKSLGRCEDSDLGGSNVERLIFSAVLVLVHRDNFGHGEVGRPSASDQRNVAKYRRARVEVLNESYVCRLLEAQRVLMAWCLDNL